MWDWIEDKWCLQYLISKLFICMVVGLVFEEGIFIFEFKLGEYFIWLILVLDLIVFFFVDFILYDLLWMFLGYDVFVFWVEEWVMFVEKDWVKYYMLFLIDRVFGEVFIYSSVDIFMILVMFQVVLGQIVKDYLVFRLFDLLEIYNVEWEIFLLGIILGCVGLQFMNEELGWFGQFLFQKGNWNGSQLVFVEWID